MSNVKQYNKKMLIANLKKVAADMKKVPTGKEYSNHVLSISCRSTLRNYFGTYKNALQKAGLIKVERSIKK